MIDTSLKLNQVKPYASMHRKRFLQLGLLAYDLLCICLSTFLAVIIRFEDIIFPGVLAMTGRYAPWFCLVFASLLMAFRLYKSLWRYSGFTEASKILLCMFIGMVICIAINDFFSLGVSRAVIIVTSMLSMISVSVARFGYRFYRQTIYSKDRISSKPPLLVVGAGFTGAYVITQVQEGITAVKCGSIVLVDDDPQKQGMRIHGAPVIGYIRDIAAIVKKRSIVDIIIAIPSLSHDRFAEVFKICNATGCHVQMVPLLEDADDRRIAPVRDVNISDILFRNEVTLDKESIGSYLSGKRVLITGGGGSIGSEICRQVARFGVQSIAILDIYENSAYELFCEMNDKYGGDVDVKVYIGSIRDKRRLEMIYSQFQPEIVFHAAAHKHVPLMEDSPLEAIKNNVSGTLNVLEISQAFGVERFVQISTDKAVNPTNIMGASKRVAELLVQIYARRSSMRCMAVRFGNVLGSHGSVIPLMERQIKNGGPVKVTHPDITRYFMTISEASQLVLQAGALADPGAIYVLDMKDPIRIMDLAEKLIRLYDYEPNVSMPIVITGLRKGEKLYEELTMADELSSLVQTEYGRIFQVKMSDVDLDAVDRKIQQMIRLAQNNDFRSFDILQQIVPNFHPQSEAKENEPAMEEPALPAALLNIE